MHESDPTITSSNYSYSKTSVNKKPFIIGGAALVLVAGALLTIFVILPKIKDSAKPEEDEIEEIIIDEGNIIEYETEEEYLNHLFEEINNAADRTAKLTAELNLVSHYVVVEEFENAEAKMAEISTEGFNTEDFYRYYNVYSRIYADGRNDEKYDYYRTLTVDYLNRLQDEHFEEIYPSE